MKLNTNIAFALTMLVVLMAVTVIAEDAKKVTTPTLAISQQVAISAIEGKKQELQKAFEQLMTQESQIEAEFSNQHPGFHVNPQTFAVEADPVVSPAPPKIPVTATPVAAPAKK